MQTLQNIKGNSKNIMEPPELPAPSLTRADSLPHESPADAAPKTLKNSQENMQKLQNTKNTFKKHQLAALFDTEIEKYKLSKNLRHNGKT